MMGSSHLIWDPLDTQQDAEVVVVVAVAEAESVDVEVDVEVEEGSEKASSASMTVETRQAEGMCSTADELISHPYNNWAMFFHSSTMYF